MIQHIQSCLWLRRISCPLEGSSVRIDIIGSECVDDTIDHSGERGGGEGVVIIVIDLLNNGQTVIIDVTEDGSVGIGVEASVQDLRGLTIADRGYGSRCGGVVCVGVAAAEESERA